jgi:hypothetical protein
MNLIIGDSHVINITLDNCDNFYCRGATAKGLNNPDSASKFRYNIIDLININNYNHVFFLFGGVDVDIILLKKLLSEKHIDYAEYNLIVIENYLKFIIDNFPNQTVTVLSIGLPTLDDDCCKKKIIQYFFPESSSISEIESVILKSNIPNIFERTEIAINFNDQLRRKINTLGLSNINFLDITTFTYDSHLKRIKNEFYTKNEIHNYNRNPYYVSIINSYLHP